MWELNANGVGPTEEEFFLTLENYLDPDEYKTKKAKEERWNNIIKICSLKEGMGCVGNNSLFPTEDKNLTLVKIERKEIKIWEYVLGKNYMSWDEDLLELEEKYGMMKNFYSWVHLSCAVFTKEVYFTPSGLLKIGKMNEE